MLATTGNYGGGAGNRTRGSGTGDALPRPGNSVGPLPRAARRLHPFPAASASVHSSRGPLGGPHRAAVVAPAHRWEPQREGEAPALWLGCPVCGGEVDCRRGVWLYRLPEESTFSPAEPPCRAVRNHVVPFWNPENARRKLRTCALVPRNPGLPLPKGERCPACGYGSSMSEGARHSSDLRTLEATATPEDKVAFLAAGEAYDAWRARRRA